MMMTKTEKDLIEFCQAFSLYYLTKDPDYNALDEQMRTNVLAWCAATCAVILKQFDIQPVKINNDDSLSDFDAAKKPN